MNRRAFLAAAGAAALLPRGAAAGADDWAASFQAALPGHPWLLGFRMPERDRLAADAVVEGRLPAGLSGTLYRNGPAGHEVGGWRYRHWFDGDGMLQAFHIGDGRVRHVGRYVATAKRAAEQAAGRALVPAFGSVPPTARPPARPDDANAANINVIRHAGRLLALWEAGSPYQVDPETLETLGRHVFSKETDGLPFTAHPRRDRDGTLWGFGYSVSNGALVLYRISPQGALRDVALVPVEGLGMVHDFVLTVRHLVIPVPPYAFDPARARDASFMDAHVWQPGRNTRVLIVDKNDLSRRRWAELPAQWIFHYGNGWEEADGTIAFDACRYGHPDDVLLPFRAVMRGETVAAGLPARPILVRLRPDGRAEQTEVAGIAAEFPRIDERRRAERHRHVFAGSADGAGHPLFNAVVRLDLEEGRHLGFRYGPDQIAEEHVFVPDPEREREGAGWLIGTTLDLAAGVTRLNVLDAADLPAGPVARASLPYPLPLGLHGSFVPA